MEEEKTAGIIYGTSTTRGFHISSTSSGIARGIYVSVDIDRQDIIGVVDEVEARGGIDYKEARDIYHGLSSLDGDTDISAKVRIIGFKDNNGNLKRPHRPPKPGKKAFFADPVVLADTLGLSMEEEKGAYVGKLLGGGGLKVHLDINRLIQTHVAILARTGGGKSYAAGVFVEELLKKGVAVLVLDPHGEYTSLLHPNIDEESAEDRNYFGVSPKSYADKTRIFTLDGSDDTIPLRFNKLNLEAEELMAYLNMHPSSIGVSLLYKVVDRLKYETKYYSLRDIMSELELERNQNKYAVINQLERIDSMRIFSEQDFTSLDTLVEEGVASVLNLKGINMIEKDIAVTHLLSMLYSARRKEHVPPFMIIAEEAHQFCPQGKRIMTSNVMNTLAAEGRKFGIGLCVVSQRPAKVDKNVLSQCNTQIILKVTNPNDLKAIVASVEGLTSKSVDDIQHLSTGTALVMGAGITVPVFVKIRVRETRHGGKGVQVL